MGPMIEITKHVSIGADELTFKASRSGGPGGQNVNKVNTRITLLFDLAGSPSLTEPQKRRVARRLATRIDKQGVLRVVSQKHRTQEGNRRAAVERFVSLLAEAIRPKPVRKKTKIPRSANERRLKEKKQRGQLKKSRRESSWKRDWSD